MKEYQRTERLAAEMQRELALVLRDAVRDPRLGMVTVQEVRVTRDLAHAKVFFTCLDAEPVTTARLLNGTLSGFLRRELAHRIRVRSMPQLHFVYDTSIESGERLAALIEEAVGQERESDENAPVDDRPAAD